MRAASSKSSWRARTSELDRSPLQKRARGSARSSSSSMGSWQVSQTPYVPAPRRSGPRPPREAVPGGPVPGRSLPGRVRAACAGSGQLIPDFQLAGVLPEFLLD